MSLLTPAEAARRLGVNIVTLRRWVGEGKLKAEKTAGGHYRYPEDVIEKLKSENRI